MGLLREKKIIKIEKNEKGLEEGVYVNEKDMVGGISPEEKCRHD